MSHEALEKTSKGRATYPNVWFVGVTPRRNPELVVAVLWQNGEFSYYPARIGAKVVSAYVEKQRRLAHNLVPVKAAAPAEMGAIWTTPGTGGKAGSPAGEGRMQAGTFLVKDGEIVGQAKAGATRNTSPQGLKPNLSLSATVGVSKATPFQNAASALVANQRAIAGRNGHSSPQSRSAGSPPARSRRFERA